MQDYHNLNVTAFNANVEELAKRTADLSDNQGESSSISARVRWRTRGL